RDEFNLLLGERTAEDIKIAIGSAYELEEPLETSMRGRDLITGLPKEVIVNDEQIRRALAKSVRKIVSDIKSTIEETPPELVADIMTRGIILAGGGVQLRNLDHLIYQQTQIPTHIADDPMTCVVRGTGLVLEDLDALRDVLIPTQLERIPR
ncbi:MAG: hypothetical protein ACD_68C00108G0004, partial [uncultured bacterium]